MIKKYKNMVQLQLIVLCGMSLGLVQSSLEGAARSKKLPIPVQNIGWDDDDDEPAPKGGAAKFSKKAITLADFEKLLDDNIRKGEALIVESKQRISNNTFHEAFKKHIESLVKEFMAFEDSNDYFDFHEQLTSKIFQFSGLLNELRALQKVKESIIASQSQIDSKAETENVISQMLLVKEKLISQKLQANAKKPSAPKTTEVSQLVGKTSPVSMPTTSSGSVSSAKFAELEQQIKQLQDDEIDQFNNRIDKLIEYRKNQQKDANSILSEYGRTVQDIIVSCAQGKITQPDVQPLIVEFKENVGELESTLIGMFI